MPPRRPLEARERATLRASRGFGLPHDSGTGAYPEPASALALADAQLRQAAQDDLAERLRQAGLDPDSPAVVRRSLRRLRRKKTPGERAAELWGSLRAAAFGCRPAFGPLGEKAREGGRAVWGSWAKLGFAALAPALFSSFFTLAVLPAFDSILPRAQWSALPLSVAGASSFLQAALPWLLALAAGAAIAVPMALPCWVGPSRAKAEAFFAPLRAWRERQGFFALMDAADLMREAGLSLPEAIERLALGASPWHAEQIERWRASLAESETCAWSSGFFGVEDECDLADYAVLNGDAGKALLAFAKGRADFFNAQRGLFPQGSGAALFLSVALCLGASMGSVSALQDDATRYLTGPSGRHEATQGSPLASDDSSDAGSVSGAPEAKPLPRRPQSPLTRFLLPDLPGAAPAAPAPAAQEPAPAPLYWPGDKAAAFPRELYDDDVATGSDADQAARRDHAAARLRWMSAQPGGHAR
jgi:hypothetical protein